MWAPKQLSSIVALKYNKNLGAAKASLKFKKNSQNTIRIQEMRGLPYFKKKFFISFLKPSRVLDVILKCIIKLRNCDSLIDAISYSNSECLALWLLSFCFHPV